MECNRFLVATLFLLAVMAASVAVAIMFPYEELNAKDAAALLAADEAGGGEVGGGAVGPAGLADVATDLATTAVKFMAIEVASTADDVVVEASSTADEVVAEATFTADEVVAEAASTVETRVAKSDNEEDGLSAPAPAPAPAQHSQLFGGEGDLDEGERRRAQCQSLLRQAASSDTGLLLAPEYAAVVAELVREAAPRISPSGRYNDLPFRLKINFIHLSCACLDCCPDDNGIYVGEVEQQVMEETREAICAATVAAIEEELKEGWAGA